MKVMNTSAYNEHLAKSVKRLYNLMEQHFNGVLRPYGVARSQWYVLYHLSQKQPMTQRELQVALGVEAATVTAVIDALEKKGWITRGQSPLDGRAKTISFTQNGRRLWDILPDPIIAVRKQMLKGVTSTEEQTARLILEKVIANLEQ